MKGDPKPVTLIEDTAVNVEHLPEYMDEIEENACKIRQRAQYFMHISDPGNFISDLS